MAVNTIDSLKANEQALHAQIKQQRLALSYELFPSRSTESFAKLQETISHLEATKPEYVSVTCKPGRENLAQSLQVVDYLLQETSLKPLAHLTCTLAKREELKEAIHALFERGVRGILALRGDYPPNHDPSQDELPFARYLVELIRECEEERSAFFAAARVAVGVAAYPVKHPESKHRQTDIEVLVAKQKSGANFAITQVFWDPEDYQNLVQRARHAGVTIPIVPGFFPATDPLRLLKLQELSGVKVPGQLLAALIGASNETERRKIGLEYSAQLIQNTLKLGAPGVHLFTFNQHRDALDLLDTAASYA